MPNLPIAIATAAALCAVPLMSAAQMSSSAPSSTTSPPAASTSRTGAATGETTGATTGTTTGGTAATGAAANTNATAGTATQPLAAGMTVKDNTGASIGQVAKLDTVNGTAMATIKMGADSFQVPAANLATANGAATINLTQAQIAAQLHPKK